VDARNHLEEAPPSSASPGTLGDVLYAKPGRPRVGEAEWAGLVRAVAARDQAALHALYERSHHVVYTLVLRILRSREAAEEVTLDVFHDLWRRASRYDPANGTVLGWIMNQARSRAIDRLRFDHRVKRTEPADGQEPWDVREAADPSTIVQLQQQSCALRTALGALKREEREAIETTFLLGLTHLEAAARLEQPLGTLKSRIRSGLSKLRRAMDDPAEAR
jgi:RNA polymerase sigma-70 factor (ECF subfamily)